MSHSPSLQEWQQVYTRVSPPVRDWVFTLVEAHAVDLAAAFYRDLLASSAASNLMSGDGLPQRLMPALQRWLLFLFDPANAASPSPTIALQRHVGEVHARVGVPWEWVAFGFRRLRQTCNDCIQAASEQGLHLQAVLYAADVIDIAEAEMSLAQLSVRPLWADANAAVSTLHQERTRPLLALDEEEKRFLQTMLSTVDWPSIHALGATPLGQWVTQEAPLLFADTDHLKALQEVQQNLLRLDTDLLPRLQGKLEKRSASQAVLREIVAGLEVIKQQIHALFDSLVASEGHRDALTQLFSRPLLNAIMRREIGLARRRQSTFSVLLVTIDHFKHIGSQFGHVVGNHVLQYVANLLSAQVRASDYVFRYGPEEFMLLLVDLDAEQSLVVAEKVRSTVETATISPAESDGLQLTLSLGVTTYAGEVEISALTDRAEQALERATRNGRNQVVSL